ncbi:SRPBCC family protein [Flavivirga rizhaonensis]|uniref:SRPBCC domain-containing protein n=1 Tax=Flavivirga rizhaonensis TaxID=2559571 RepID=A0A4S1DX59_9FLAO|nr:SRPBCC domain-containing protein [Flavivirga rizhaonensis]TGV02821.1 SRPBCC domain-containing protein [Flavivirga rizhaonensis]
MSSNIKQIDRHIKNYKKQLKVNVSSKQVFCALNEGLHSWWGKISNSEFKAGGQFTIQFENDYWWTFKIIEYTPNQELVWKCIDGEPDFNKEWIGHVLHWEIEDLNGKSLINFNQVGLTPNIDCYEVCSTTWDRFITNSLKNYLEVKK